MSEETERTKIAVDCVKHITTLTTGTILLIAAGIDKVTRPVVGWGWLVASISLMLVCLILCFSFLLDVGVIGRRNPRAGAQVFFIGSSFVFGIICIVIFGAQAVLHSFSK
jgi:hypothetical protein